MLFNSYEFILVFLPLAVAGYFLLNKFGKAISKIWLIVVSFVFYAWMNPKFALMLLASMAVNYTIVKLMQRAEGGQVKEDDLKKDGAEKRGVGKIDSSKIYLTLALVFNVGSLLYFKYAGFFLSNLNAILATDFNLTNILLPLGISFITFEQISFVVDCYRNKDLNSCFLNYAYFISFFPKILSGPILLYEDFCRQIEKEEVFLAKVDNLGKGLYGFARGLAKKVLIADVLAKVVTAGFTDVAGLGTFGTLVLILAYSLQLYFDFSGYSDMAVGVARMFNIELSINFDSPYKAGSVTEFWKRWHMSLTAFLTKYIYIPLGGNRRDFARTCINILIVYFISGFWHGANWTFIIWGLMHGILMVFERILLKKCNWKKGIGFAATFLFVNIAWLLFASDNISVFGNVLAQLLNWDGGAGLNKLAGVFAGNMEILLLYKFGLRVITDHFYAFPLLVFLAVVLGFTFFGKNTRDKLEQFSYSRKQMLLTVFLLFWSIVSLSNVSQFLYVNF